MSPHVVSPEFVGRTPELDVLLSAYDRTLDGTTSIAIIGGEAGVGKTRLIKEFLAALEAKPRVFEGSCLELGADGLPYAPFVAVIRRLVRDLGTESVAGVLPGSGSRLARWLPELDRTDSGDPDRSGEKASGKVRLFEEVLALLEYAASVRPTVIVMEDLHWADAASRELLSFLARNLKGARLLFIGTYRSTDLEPAHPLRALFAEVCRSEDVQRIDLERLTFFEVGRQMAAILARPPEPVLVRRVYSRSEGNPLFVEALLEGGDRVPDTVRELLLAGLWKLPEESRDVLRVASVAGDRVRHNLLAAVVDLGEQALDTALRQAVDQQLLIAESDGYAFRHALIRAAVYENLLPGERSRLHGRYAAALRDDPGLLPADRLAVELSAHWYAAGDRERALEATWSAAEWAGRSFAYDEQRRLLPRVLELWDRVPDPAGLVGVDKVTVLLTGAEACLHGGEPARGIEYATAAVDEVDRTTEPERAAEALRLRAHLTHRVDFGGREDAEAGLALLPTGDPTPLRVRLQLVLASYWELAGDSARSRAAAEEALHSAEQVGDPMLVAHAQMQLSLPMARLGEIAEALELLATANSTVQALGDYDRWLTGVTYEVVLRCAISCEYERAVELGLEGVRTAHRVGLASMRGAMLAWTVALALVMVGRWDEATATIDESLASDPPLINRCGLLFGRLQVALLRGDLGTAEQTMAEITALREQEPLPEPETQQLQCLECQLLLDEGRYDEAGRVLGEALAGPDFGAAEPDTAWMLLLAGTRIQRALASRAGRDTAASARVDGLTVAMDARSREVPGDTRFQTAARLTYGAIRASKPDWDAAIAAWRELNVPYELARSLFAGAEHALGTGSREVAVMRLREAAAIAERLGAEPLRREVDQLASRGRLALPTEAFAPEPSESSGSPVSSDDFGLTRRELEVLRLMAEGQTNRQIAETLFISVNTAGAHVSHILTKLGVSSRTEAASIAHRLSLFETPTST